MKGVYECEILAHSEVGPGAVRTLLKGPHIARQAEPGQFVNVQVTRNTDPLLRRPFSVHAAYPDQGVFSLLYVVKGRGTALLKTTDLGERISVVGPLGRGFDLGDSPDAEHIIVAGGCGAAPLHFLCDALCRKWGCQKVTVLAGAQSRDAVLCEREFRSHGVEVGISTDDGSHGTPGFVTELLAEHLSHRAITSPQVRLPSGEGGSTSGPAPPLCGEKGVGSQIRVYSCGPHAMLREVYRVCREHGITSCQVSLENVMACGIGVCMGCVQKAKGAGKGSVLSSVEGRQPEWHHERVCADGPVFNAEEVIWQ